MNNIKITQRCDIKSSGTIAGSKQNIFFSFLNALVIFSRCLGSFVTQVASPLLC